MNDHQQELLSLLSDILEVAPSLRLGQLLGILTDRTDHPYTTNPVADVDDHELLPAARELLNDFRRRQAEQNERGVEYARAG